MKVGFDKRFLVLPLFAAACATTDVTDELAGETSDAVDGKADGAVDGASTYFTIATTNGTTFTLARVNRTTTTCADGHVKSSCTTTQLDWSESSLTSPIQDKLTGAARNGFALVRGRFGKPNRFIVTEGWVAEGGNEPDGVFARVIDNGIRCITAPCPSMTEKGLNGSNTANIAALDYAPSGLSEKQVDAFSTGVFDAYGIIVAGVRYTDHENGHTAKGRTVSNAYHKLVDTGCYVGGCSRQVCSENASVITTCQWKPEYACYADATCERQDNGSCGWTQSEELTTCLAQF